VNAIRKQLRLIYFKRGQKNRALCVSIGGDYEKKQRTYHSLCVHNYPLAIMANLNHGASILKKQAKRE
jgi:hypothetical protein